MNNKVLIILALLLISCVGLLSIRKPVRTERFNSNIQNQNPREHERSENITEEVQQLNEDINKLENIDPDVQPIRVTVTRETEPDKPKEQKGFCIDKPEPEVKPVLEKKDSKRLSYLKQKLNATTIDMSKYILKSRVTPQPDMNKYVLKSEIPTCPKGPDLTDYVLKTRIPVCDKVKRKKSKKKKTKKSKKKVTKPKPKPKPRPKPKCKSKSKKKKRSKSKGQYMPDKKLYVVRKLSPPKKEKPQPKCTKYIPRMPINLTRNQPPKKCKIIRRVIKHGDIYGAY